MARTPNYKFDRMERDRAKAAKKAQRLKEKAERRAETDLGPNQNGALADDAEATASDSSAEDE